METSNEFHQVELHGNIKTRRPKTITRTPVPLPDDPAVFQELKNMGIKTDDDFRTKTNYYTPERAFYNRGMPQDKCYWCFVYGKCYDHMLLDADEIPKSLRKELGIGDIKLNMVKCKRCDTVIRSYHRHDFRECPCGAVFVDGGSWYSRVGGNAEDWEGLVKHYADL